MIGPSGTFQAPKARDAESRPTCKVHGMVARNAICGHVIVGMKYCGFKGHCEHKSVAEMITGLVSNHQESEKRGEKNGS